MATNTTKKTTTKAKKTPAKRTTRQYKAKARTKAKTPTLSVNSTQNIYKTRLFFVFVVVVVLFALTYSYFNSSQTSKNGDLTATTPNPQAYTCPTTAWANCMPGPQTTPQQICVDEKYQLWVLNNCPDFEGIAY